MYISIHILCHEDWKPEVCVEETVLLKYLKDAFGSVDSLTHLESAQFYHRDNTSTLCPPQSFIHGGRCLKLRTSSTQRWRGSTPKNIRVGRHSDSVQHLLKPAGRRTSRSGRPAFRPCPGPCWCCPSGWPWPRWSESARGLSEWSGRGAAPGGSGQPAREEDTGAVNADLWFAWSSPPAPIGGKTNALSSPRGLSKCHMMNLQPWLLCNPA